MNKRKITTRVVFDGVVDKTYTQTRQVYTDDVGEYVNCGRNKYHIKNDSFDIVYVSGKAISFVEFLNLENQE
jgi:hypothetical protein